jgi:hypothetical protein
LIADRYLQIKNIWVLLIKYYTNPILNIRKPINNFVYDSRFIFAVF